MAGVELPLSSSELRELESLSAAYRKDGLKALPTRVVERLDDILFRVDRFLRKVCCHETSDSNVVAFAVNKAREMYFDRVSYANKRLSPGSIAVRVIRRLQTPLSWLVWHARAAVRQAENLKRKGVPFPIGDKLGTEKFAPPARRCAMASNGCRLSAARKRSPQLIRAGHCFQACDILMMAKDLEMKQKEIGFILKIPRSTVAGRIEACNDHEATTAENLKDELRGDTGKGR
jgi:hypothetical protein